MNRLSIVILNWNGWRETLECLASLRACRIPDDLSVETIVVDNCSSDDSVSHLLSIAGIQLIQSPINRGFASGSNLGIRASLEHGSDWIMLLNNDTTVDPGSITILTKALADHPKAGIATPKILYPGTPSRIWYAGGRFRYPRIIGDMIGLNELDHNQHNQPREVDFAVGCCMLMTRATLETVGLLDERFFFYEEDIDYCYRAHLQGISTWYQPDAIIFHHVGLSTRGNLPYRSYLQAWSRTVFFRKHIHGLRWVAVLFFETIRLIRLLFRTTFAGEPEIGRQYLRGLRAGWTS